VVLWRVVAPAVEVFVNLHTPAVLVIKCHVDIELVHMQALEIRLLFYQYASRIGELNLFRTR
jgi:hypothetical protein